MEYTDYFVVKGTGEELRGKLTKVVKRAVIVDGAGGDCVPFVVAGKTDKLPRTLKWLVRVFDAEGSAWGFELWVDGKHVAKATYGENAEWGIDESDNGFQGDRAAAAGALGTTAAKLEKCLKPDGVEAFCKLIGFTHQYMLYAHERDMPAGVVLMSEIA